MRFKINKLMLLLLGFYVCVFKSDQNIVKRIITHIYIYIYIYIFFFGWDHNSFQLGLKRNFSPSVQILILGVQNKNIFKNIIYIKKF